jgi:hypothetical protein
MKKNLSKKLFRKCNVIQSNVLTMILGQDSPLCTPIVNVLASIKDAEDAIQKCITWPKKSSNLGK